MKKLPDPRKVIDEIFARVYIHVQQELTPDQTQELSRETSDMLRLNSFETDRIPKNVLIEFGLTRIGCILISFRLQ